MKVSDVLKEAKKIYRNTASGHPGSGIALAAQGNRDLESEALIAFSRAYFSADDQFDRAIMASEQDERDEEEE